MTSFSSVQSRSAATTAAAGGSSLYKLRRSSFSTIQNSQIFRFHHRRATSSTITRKTTFRIRAIDAAQPYDYEGEISSTKLKIAIVGFGNFGQFLAKAFVRQGHSVLAHSRSDYSAVAVNLGVSFFPDAHDLCEKQPDVILLSTSITSTEEVLRSLPVQRLKRNTLFVDVLSVKQFPKNLFLQVLPSHFDILCTHPMFGPESGKDSWNGLPFVFDKVRIGDERSRMARVDAFLDIFEKEGCRMVEMSCAEHDRHAASSQFITHTIGRVLEKFGLQTTPINTKGYDALLDLVRNTASDSFDLYYGLFLYNENAMEQLGHLGEALESLKMELFEYLHKLNRKQLFGEASRLERPMMSKFTRYGPSATPSNGASSNVMNRVFVCDSALIIASLLLLVLLLLFYIFKIKN